MKKRHLAGAFGMSAVLAAGVVAGCASAPAQNSNSANKATSVGAAATVAPQKGGTLVYALPPATNITWYLPIENSQNASLYNAQLFMQMYPGVIYINNQYGIDYADSFANKITYNATGTVFTIQLKQNWKWSDGQPVTAQDVVWDYNLIKATDNPKAPAPWPNYNAGSGGVPDNVKSVVATGKYTVTITLKKPVNQQWFIYNGIGQLTPLPEHAWNKYPSNMNQEITYLGKEATNPTFFKVVDGPFKLQSAKSSQAWVLVPNPTFGGHKSTLDKVIFQYEASSDAEFSALKTGAINLGYLDPAQWGSRQALTSVGDSIVPGYNFGYYFVELNQLKGSPLYSAFSDLKVRQALEYAIDQNTIDKEIYHGYAPPQYGPIPATPKTVFLDPKLQKPLFPFSLSKAKQLLESDGWTLQNGVMTKNGQKLEFDLMYPSGSPSTTQMVELIQQDWQQIGVVVNLKPEEFAQEIGIMSNSKEPSKWAAAAGTGITYGGSYPSGEQLFEPGGLDNFGYDNPTLDQLIKKTNEPAASAAQSQQNFFKYEEYVSEQVPVLWNNSAASLGVVAPNVHNATSQYMNPTTGYPLLNYIWISK
ncbi:peptide ABC transporter substrate-binding protein [Alicyclobacillus hesperidum]|uniref:Peptide ABC transporter substrate-binding protein n=1 Tax=Alicyclobacillus hesperidum TaxID=89784 RepID=A0A1H2QDZ8_9BACL|nr:peptide ABC transporter substrate-binding protein [Alicyclobacillus hesperidum]GLV12689.1 peptide ABC transporter substrate-binding protein [Alicyclobacillus hesperidum]SDW05130.1 peptide/nickel transport system substrate-binding protein [Alicyclobacillus hesperidum]